MLHREDERGHEWVGGGKGVALGSWELWDMNAHTYEQMHAVARPCLDSITEHPPEWRVV